MQLNITTIPLQYRDPANACAIGKILYIDSKRGEVATSCRSEHGGHVWEIRTATAKATPLFKLSAHGQPISTLSVCHSRNKIYTGSPDTRIISWTRLSDENWWSAPGPVVYINTVIKTHERSIEAMCISKDEKILCTGSTDGMVSILDTKSDTLIQKIDNRHHNNGGVSALHIVDEILFTGHVTGWIYAWNITQKCSLSGSIDKLLPGRAVTAFCTNEQFLFSGSQDGGIFVWQVTVSSARKTHFVLLQYLLVHEDRINSLCYWKNYNYLVAGSRDSTISFWKPSDSLKSDSLKRKFEFALRHKLDESVSQLLNTTEKELMVALPEKILILRLNPSS